MKKDKDFIRYTHRRVDVGLYKKIDGKKKITGELTGRTDDAVSIIIDDKEIEVGPGSVLDVPLGAVHRIGNTGDKKLVFIEVACGDDLSEEDIIRIQDDYDRQES